MIRNESVEAQAVSIATEVWPYLKTEAARPRIESKHGGSSAAYYINEHCIRFRSNVWAKLTLAQKRLIVIHELFHAAGNRHQPIFLSSADYISRRIYLAIWGNDYVLQEFDRALEVVVENAVSKSGGLS